jgi:hypothetical protein
MGRKGRPVSNETLNAALRALGYTGDEMTTHGVRRLASTLKPAGEGREVPVDFLDGFGADPMPLGPTSTAAYARS